jgi:hypothetical protein
LILSFEIRDRFANSSSTGVDSLEWIDFTTMEAADGFFGFDVIPEILPCTIAIHRIRREIES